MTQINLRVDDDVKKRAEEVCSEIGMSMSTAIVIFLKKMGRENRIPFEVSIDPFYSRENIEELERRIGDIEKDASVLKEHELIEVDE